MSTVARYVAWRICPGVPREPFVRLGTAVRRGFAEQPPRLAIVPAGDGIMAVIEQRIRGLRHDVMTSRRPVRLLAHLAHLRLSQK